MRSLSAAALLALCESGAHATPAERASALAGVAAPELHDDEIDALPVGARDALVLALREATLGSTYEGWAGVPRARSGSSLYLLLHVFIRERTARLPARRGDV